MSAELRIVVLATRTVQSAVHRYENEVAMPITVAITTHMWLWWAQIAIDQERLALQARDDALRETTSGPRFGEFFSAETFASMIAVAASSHSLDALYGRVKVDLAGGAVRTDNRWSTILETVRQAAKVTGTAEGGQWAAEFEWLYDLRDSAVHYEEKMSPSVPHPTGTSSGAENARYCAEAATRAVNLALEVLETCLTSPRPPLEPWATPLGHVLPGPPRSARRPSRSVASDAMNPEAWIVLGDRDRDGRFLVVGLEEDGRPAGGRMGGSHID